MHKIAHLADKYTTAALLKMLNLPENVLNLVMDFAGTSDFWKARFSNDVLTKINKGIKFVGGDMHDGVIVPCANCYSYGLCSEEYGYEPHEHYDEISYSDMKKKKCDTLLMKIPSLPLEVHEWMMNNNRVVKLRNIKMEIMIGVCRVAPHDAYMKWWGS